MSEKIFEIKSGKALIIKSLFECIKPYLKETNIIINNEGIKISTADQSMVSVTYIKLWAEKFESFHCTSQKIIGIDTNLFYRTIKSANRRETITLYMNKNDEDKLGIELADPLVGRIKDYKLPLLALEEDIYNIQTMDFPFRLNLPTVQFQQIIKDMQIIDGKVLDIQVSGHQIVFSCLDGNIDFKTSISDISDNINMDQLTLLQQNGEDLRSVKFEKTSNTIVQGRFQLSHLLYFIKASHLCENMNLLINNDVPLVLEYFIADIGCLKFLLAPLQN